MSVRSCFAREAHSAGPQAKDSVALGAEALVLLLTSHGSAAYPITSASILMMSLRVSADRRVSADGSCMKGRNRLAYTLYVME